MFSIKLILVGCFLLNKGRICYQYCQHLDFKVLGSARIVLFSSVIVACRRGENIQHHELRVEQKNDYRNSWIESVVKEVDNNLLKCFTIKALGFYSESVHPESICFAKTLGFFTFPYQSYRARIYVQNLSVPSKVYVDFKDQQATTFTCKEGTFFISANLLNPTTFFEDMFSKVLFMSCRMCMHFKILIFYLG